jgi:D-psicose/D-tagatose/L-ribulose 3-epimerase
MPPRYAVHANAWTSAWTPDDARLIDRAAGLGLDALEIPLGDLDAIEPEVLRDRAAAAGIELVTSTVLTAETSSTSDDERVREAAADHLQRCVDAAAAMGATVLGGVTYAAWGDLLGPPTELHLDRSAEVLRAAARYAAPRGVRIALEPVNRYESSLINTVDQALAHLDRIGEDNVGLHLDTYHMNIEEEEFGAPVRRAAERLLHVHLTESHRGVPGTGTVDWPAVMGALADAGYDGYVGLESFSELSPEMAVALSTWRPLGPPSDELVTEGLAYLRPLYRPTAVEA